jgi:hypothetical protein
VSDQAIIYWHQKGSKPQGRQHFLKATEGLVKVLHIYFDDRISFLLLTPRLVFAGAGRQRGRVKAENRVYFFTVSVSLCIYIQFGARTFGHIIRETAGGRMGRPPPRILYPSTQSMKQDFKS